MKNKVLRLAPFIIFILFALFFWRGLSLHPQELPSVQLGKPLPAFDIPTLYNDRITLTPSHLKGQTYLINIWASWCDACTEEQLFLLKLARKGMSIYGINYKDDSLKARQWLQDWGNPYQLIGEDKAGHVAIQLGVYGTPETFLVDKKGIIQLRFAGPMNEEIWKNVFLPKLAEIDKRYVNVI